MEINIIRCILILLVILIHLTPFKECCPNAQSAILAFVVPLFLFITGYLFNVNKKWRQYVLYLRSQVIMYAVFETIYIILSNFFPVKDGISELSVFVILYKLIIQPIGPYWFLHTMIISGSIYYTIYQTCRKLNIGSVIPLSVLVSVVLSYCSPLLGLMSPLAYFAGVVFRTYNCQFKDSFVATLIAIITMIYGIIYNPAYAIQLSYFSILLGVCTIESLIWWTRRLPAKVTKVLNYVGANTLPIYLFHPVFTLASKLLLGNMINNGNLFCFCILTIAVAAIGSIIIGHTLDITGISMLLFKKRIMR